MGNNYFNDDYECYECGAKMEKADEEVLVCPVCGHSVDAGNLAIFTTTFMKTNNLERRKGVWMR